MTEKLRDVLRDEASAAHVPPTELGPVLRAGGRAVRRRRFAGSAAVAAVMALAVAIAPSIAEWPDDDPPVTSGTIDFTEREVTYSLKSTIYFGDHEIDVSPYKMYSFVQTDDGFVFTTGNNKVYFTDGDGIHQIGDHLRGYGELAADDRGSYVGWMEAGANGPNEAVVYDTADQAEVLRTADGNQRGCYADPNDNGAAVPLVNVIDGDVAYVCNSDGVTTWSLTTGEKLDSLPVKAVDGIYDAAGGYLVEGVPGRPYPVPVVWPATGAGETRFPELMYADLSPNATYVMGTPTDSPGGEIEILDRVTREDVTPRAPDDYDLGSSRWLDDDRYVVTISSPPDDASATEMLVCSISSGGCDVAANFHIEGPAQFLTPGG